MEYQRVELPDEYRTALGDICIIWAEIEAEVERAIWVLAPSHDSFSMLALTTHLGLRERFGVLITICGYGCDADIALSGEMRSLAKGVLGGRMKRRNRYIHRDWTIRKDGSIGQMSVESRGGLEVEFKPVAVSDLHRLVADIEADIKKLYELLDRGVMALAQQPSWRDKQK